MSIEIIFLGTAASIPTSSRALPSVALLRKGELFLFDCGEGTQRQMIKAQIGFNRKTLVLVTHMHGDHVLGLAGLLQTMSLLGRNKLLRIYGPIGIKAFVDALIQTVRFSLIFPIEIHEIGFEDLILEEKEYSLHATMAEHSVPSLAYALVEKERPGRFHPERAVSLNIPEGPSWYNLQQGLQIKLPNGHIVKPEDVLDSPRSGRKIVYVGDTAPSENIANFAKGADALIHEATFSDDMIDRAEEDKHSTPSGAAEIARKAETKLLILTHISARYGETDTMLQQAKKIFADARIAEDFMRVEIPLREE